MVGCPCDDQLWGSGRGSMGRVPMVACTSMASRKNIQKNCLELLADVTLFSTLITQKLVLPSGVYAGIIPSSSFSPLHMSLTPKNSRGPHLRLQCSSRRCHNPSNAVQGIFESKGISPGFLHIRHMKQTVLIFGPSTHRPAGGMAGLLLSF